MGLSLSLNIISSFFFFMCQKEKKKGRKKKKRDEDNFNFLLVGFWASAGKGRMNNHAELKDKRAFFASLCLVGSRACWWLMLAEGEVIFSCVRYMDGVEEEEEEEVSGRGQLLFWWWTSKRDREGDVLCHTQQQQVEKSYNSNSLRTDGGFFFTEWEREKENLELLSFCVCVCIYLFEWLWTGTVAPARTTVWYFHKRVVDII